VQRPRNGAQPRHFLFAGLQLHRSGRLLRAEEVLVWESKSLIACCLYMCPRTIHCGLCRTSPVLDSADNTALSQCQATPFASGSTCDLACAGPEYVAQSPSMSATFTCVKGQWQAPNSQLKCARSCLSDVYCTNEYTLKTGMRQESSVRHPPPCILATVNKALYCPSVVRRTEITLLSMQASQQAVGAHQAAAVILATVCARANRSQASGTLACASPQAVALGSCAKFLFHNRRGAVLSA
jgi:hypothetical protein